MKTLAEKKQKVMRRLLKLGITPAEVRAFRREAKQAGKRLRPLIELLTQENEIMRDMTYTTSLPVTQWPKLYSGAKPSK